MNRAILKYFITGIFAFCIFTIQDASAQRWKLRRYEVGLGVGTMQIFGDIGGTADESNWFGLKDVKFDETNLTFNGIVRYKISPYISIKSNLNYGRGQASDDNTRNDRGRSYKVSLYEFSATGEYYFRPEDKKYRSSALYSRKGMLNNYNTLSSYFFAGIGVAATFSEHGDAAIQPADDYRSGMNLAPVIPFGIGVKYIIDDRLLINGDFGYRYSLTDYIEGYKQTWNSNSNDIYYFLNISLNYRLKTSRRGIPLFMDRKFRKYGR